MNILSPLASTSSQERRRNLRASISLPLRVRAADFSDGDLVQVADTLNTSRKGFYFHTTLDRYYKGMRLRITVPYHALASANANDWEELGEVLRIDRRSGRAYGVAVARSTPLPSTGFAVTQHRHNRDEEMTERRTDQRFPLIASVDMIDTQTRLLLRARTSDISMSGCYIDTLNPFPVGASLNLNIKKGDETVKARACVRTQHMGSGMGVAFTDGMTDEGSVLINWLFENNPNSGYFQATENGTHMSQVFDALRKAEQGQKGMGQMEGQVQPIVEHIPAPQNPDSSAKTIAYLGPGLEIRGEITGNEPLHIDGRVDGLISLGDCRLTVGQTAYVGAKILAGEVVVHGEVVGDVCASERIVIKRDASVSGDLTTSRIVIEDGAYIKATVQVRNDAVSEPSSSAPMVEADS